MPSVSGRLEGAQSRRLRPPVRRALPKRRIRIQRALFRRMSCRDVPDDRGELRRVLLELSRRIRSEREPVRRAARGRLGSSNRAARDLRGPMRGRVRAVAGPEGLFHLQGPAAGAPGSADARDPAGEHVSGRLWRFSGRANNEKIAVF